MASYFFARYDYKFCSRVSAEIFKKVLPNFVSPQQTTYCQNRFIGESNRFIADIIEVTNIFSKEEFLVTMGIEKPFNSLELAFHVSAF